MPDISHLEFKWTFQGSYRTNEPNSMAWDVNCTAIFQKAKPKNIYGLQVFEVKDFSKCTVFFLFLIVKKKINDLLYVLRRVMLVVSLLLHGKWIILLKNFLTKFICLPDLPCFLHYHIPIYSFSKQIEQQRVLC